MRPCKSPAPARQADIESGGSSPGRSQPGQLYPAGQPSGAIQRRAHPARSSRVAHAQVALIEKFNDLAALADADTVLPDFDFKKIGDQAGFEVLLLQLFMRQSKHISEATRKRLPFFKSIVREYSDYMKTDRDLVIAETQLACALHERVIEHLLDEIKTCDCKAEKKELWATLCKLQEKHASRVGTSTWQRVRMVTSYVFVVLVIFAIGMFLGPSVLGRAPDAWSPSQ